jgi:hypothetical protein
MDNNNERTDQFFRERLSVYEEMPVDQVWDKIASRLEVEKRKKLVYLFLRIAAGMTLLFSLGLGYHLIYKSDNQKAEAVITRPSASEKSSVANSGVQKTSNMSENQSLIASDKSLKTESKPQQLNDNHTYLYNTSLYNTSNPSLNNTSHADSKTPVLTSMTMLEPSLFSVPAPHRLGYRRLSQEEMQEQTAALTANNDENITDNEEKDNPWMLGSEVAPLYSYRKIESDYLSKSSVQDMNKSEQGLMALAGGLRVGYSAGRRLSVQSGLYYSRYGQQKNNGEAVSMDQIAYLDKPNVTYLSIPNSTGTIQASDGNTSRYENVIATSTGTKVDFVNNNGFPAINPGNIQISEGGITAVQYFDYLELPVTVKYKIIDRKLSFSFLGGLITNFMVNNGVKLKQDGNVESFGTTRDINKVNYQGSVGLGFDYPLMDRLAISLEPRFRYYLNPIDQRFDVHPYSLGIFAGISYTLK